MAFTHDIDDVEMGRVLQQQNGTPWFDFEIIKKTKSSFAAAIFQCMFPSDHSQAVP